ncbi:hypothetical protein V6N13_139893 [Hibiscus sabdariffa]
MRQGNARIPLSLRQASESSFAMTSPTLNLVPEVGSADSVWVLAGDILLGSGQAELIFYRVVIDVFQRFYEVLDACLVVGQVQDIIDGSCIGRN